MEEFTYNLIMKKYKDSDYIYPVAVASDDKLDHLCEALMASSRSISVSTIKLTTNSEITDKCYIVFDDKNPPKKKDKNKREMAIIVDRPVFLYKPYASARKRATTLLNKDVNDEYTSAIYEMELNKLGYEVKYIEG